jgi:glycosyltransferase involved in cell wall biosynthesis
MSQPLVSVIIPCYKQAHLIGRAIRSCFDSNNIPLEIIAVDDGSPDDVAGAINGQAGVRLIRKVNGGLSSARNAGLRQASGRFIKFLDADDWLIPGALARQASILMEFPGTILITGYRLCYEDAERPFEDHYPGFSSWEQALAQGNIAPIHAFMVSSDLIRRVGDFDETLKNHEDYDFWLRMSLLDIDAILHHRVECAYFKHTESMSSEQNHMVSGVLKVWKKHAASIGGLDLPLMTIAEHLKRCASFMNQYPGDPSLEEISGSLIQAIASRGNRANLPEALEASEAIAQSLLARSGKNRSRVGSYALRLLLETINWPLSDYEKHFVGRRLFAVGQTLLRAGNRRLALLCFEKTRGLGSTYGVDYGLLSKWLAALATMIPGPLAVAVFNATETLIQSYWKYLSRPFYGLLCPSGVKDAKSPAGSRGGSPNLDSTTR